jgi:predicted transposase/invertase (TIGR01784 family)
MFSGVDTFLSRIRLTNRKPSRRCSLEAGAIRVCLATLRRPARMTDHDLHQPNDKLLKATFSIPENASAFFQHHLPRDTASAIVWDSLSLEPSTFVDPQFAASESDLLFQVTFQGTASFLYLLFEHQSTEDPRMALRLLSYILRIWERFAANNPASTKLPPVFPLVLTQGTKPWKTSTSLEDIIDLNSITSNGLRRLQPSFSYERIELFSTPYEAIGGTPEGILALRALKAQSTGELLSDPVWDEALLHSISKDALERLLRYIYNGEVNKTLFMDRIAQFKTKPLQKKTMTLADQFREEGKLEGITEGEMAAYRRLIIRTLTLKHGTVPKWLQEAIHLIHDASRLEALHDHAFCSTSLEAFAENL